jgi:hypothetical protein
MQLLDKLMQANNHVGARNAFGCAVSIGVEGITVVNKNKKAAIVMIDVRARKYFLVANSAIFY